MMKWVAAFCCLFTALVLTSVARAQSQITTGVIQGTTQDQSGAVIVDADVIAKNLDTQTETKQKTDGDGRFVFLSLTPGKYSVTASKAGFAKIIQKDLDLTVGQAIALRLTLKISTISETVEVTGTPVIETTETQSSTTLNELAVSDTPVLGRKFEDLLTLTPGVSVVQGPDGDEISFAGQRGIFNNVSLDGGDYNNGFFGEQEGGQRAAIDITLDAVKEFQVVASGASAEFGRTAGGVVNVITKSGTDELHGSLFHYQRMEALSADPSDGKPLQDFHREQFGGTIGGPIIKQKMFYFGAVEQIFDHLVRPNLSSSLGSCPFAAPTVGDPSHAAQEAAIANNAECQRLALLNFFQTSRNQQEGLPVDHTIHNSAVLGKYDWNINNANKLSASYNFDYSRNPNQTFDVPTYGDSANGIEGGSKINAVNGNFFTTVSTKKINEAHISFAREDRPRAAVQSNVPADTAMGGLFGVGPTFRFGQPFFLEPKVDETFKRFQVRDSFSILAGKHTMKFGGEFLHSNNTQVFRGFFTGRYIFDSVLGFLHYASPASLGPGFGPDTGECANGTFTTLAVCPNSPLLLYLQHAGTNGATTDAAGASNISNQNYAFFIQDKWQIRPNLTLDYGLRWEAQIFPDPVIPPSQTVYGVNLSDPRFPSTGKIPNDLAMFQPRLGLAWDVRNNGKSVVRASWGIFNAQQNMLTQVGAITTNGVQQQEIFSGDVPGGFVGATGFDTAGPSWPGVVTPPALPPGTFPLQPGITVFDKNYRDPRIYNANFGFSQQLSKEWAGYLDVTWAKGVYLTRFVDPNNGSQLTGPAGVAACAAVKATLSSDGVCIPLNGDTTSYPGSAAFANLGSITNTQSSAHSLYRGMTVGARKRFSKGFQVDANYSLSEDLDDDSNERDPFTFRYFDRFNFRKDYTFSDRDSKHKFNLFAAAKLPWAIEFSPRIQAHTAQPITDNTLGTGTGAPCSANNSITRVVNGIDCGRNHLRKDNGFFTFDWRATRPFKFGDRYSLIPTVEMFNSFNNKNNVNPLVTPALFNFDGFLRQGVGDPLQVQLALKFQF